MLLGVVLHASMHLVWQDWPVVANEISPDLPYDDIVHAIHGFRMPVFFLLSGYFTAMLWQRRGKKAMVIHRLRRVGLPLLIGAFTIVPVHVLWIVYLRGDEINLLTPIWIFALGWIFGLQHLWFLWMLLLLVGLFVGISALGIKFTDQRVWWILIPLVLIPQLMMSEYTWGPDTASHLIVNPIVLAYYLCFFLFGVFMFQTDISIDRRWVLVLLPAIPIFYVGRIFEFTGDSIGAHVASSVLQVIYAWAMCFGTMGLFKIVASANRQWLRYMSDASYWIYLWHVALIFPAQALAAKLNWNVHLEVMLIIVAVTGILLAVYQLGVRHTWIGTMLNGRRTGRSKGGDGRSDSEPSVTVTTDFR